MPWYSYLFFLMAFFAMCGVGMHASRRNTHGMIASLVILAIWASLGLWTGGHLG